MFLAVVCFYFFFRADKKIKMAREKLGQPVPIAPLAARKKRFWLIAFLLIAGSIGFMPLLPYTVENFKSWLYFYVVPFEVVTVSLILFFIWKKLVGPSDSSK